MRKEVWRDVILSSVAFLALMWVAFFWAQKYFPMEQDSAAVAKVEEKKVAYLTFDDGPSKHTQEVLDILDTYHVKATFFVTGSNPEYYDLIKKADAKGHAIGIHTFSHDYGKIYSSEEAYFEDVNKTNALIEKQTGHKVNILRFPGGTSHTVSRKYSSGIMSTLAASVTQKGYEYYDWNASNGDGNCYVESDSLINTALKEIRDKKEVMSLMHDGTGNKATVEALPTILKSMLSQGYEFRVIDSSTPVFHHHIAN